MRKTDARRPGKKWGRAHSIAFKSAVLYTLLFGVVLAAAVGAMTWTLSARASAYRDLERAGSFLADRASRDGDFDYASFAESNNLYLSIRGPGGKEISFGRTPHPGVFYDSLTRRVERRGGAVFLRVVSLEDPGPLGRVPLPAFFAALAGLLLLAAFFGARTMHRMMRPVRDMTRAARAIGASDLGRRIEPGRARDELNELAETFNEMLDRIQASYERQRRFVNDASHELRTPLSVISGYANLLRRWGGDDRAVRAEAVDKILEETGNMQRLVERLLFLARADRQTQPVAMERFRADEMMEEIAGETRLIDGSHTIKTEFERDVRLTADRALMKQAVRAMLENSVKYTPAGGTIRLGCRRAGDRVVLTVADSGAGIPEKDLPHIFDRFYKADASRARDGQSSSGLGLSIVKWIVERHGGEIRVRSAPGLGTEMTVFLPAGPPEELPGP